MSKINIAPSLLKIAEAMFKDKEIPYNLIETFEMQLKQFEPHFDKLDEDDIHYLFFVYVMGASSGILLAGGDNSFKNLSGIVGGMQ